MLKFITFSPEIQQKSYLFLIESYYYSLLSLLIYNYNSTTFTLTRKSKFVRFYSWKKPSLWYTHLSPSSGQFENNLMLQLPTPETKVKYFHSKLWLVLVCQFVKFFRFFRFFRSLSGTEPLVPFTADVTLSCLYWIYCVGFLQGHRHVEPWWNRWRILFQTTVSDVMVRYRPVMLWPTHRLTWSPQVRPGSWRHGEDGHSRRPHIRPRWSGSGNSQECDPVWSEVRHGPGPRPHDVDGLVLTGTDTWYWHLFTNRNSWRDASVMLSF